MVNISKEPLDPEIKNSKPNFIRYPVEEFNFEVWIIVGNVKPTKLFKNLINEAKIIILTFIYTYEIDILYKYYINLE